MLVVRASNQAFHEDPSTDAVEHPQDPESAGFQWVKLLIDARPHELCASSWATPEWKVLHKELQLEPMPFHQGPLGHSKIQSKCVHSVYSNADPDPLLVNCWGHEHWIGWV